VDAEWQEDWIPKTYDKSSIYIFNATPAGWIGFIILKYYPILNKFYRAYIQPHLSWQIREKIGRVSRET